MFLNWLRKRRKAAKQRIFQNGYRYAAGCLLSSQGTQADDLMMQADNYFDITEFDRGIEEAVSDFYKLFRKNN